LGFAALNPTYELRKPGSSQQIRLAVFDPPAGTEPARPAPVGAGRKNGRQPGNKPPSLAQRMGGAGLVTVFAGIPATFGSPFLCFLSFRRSKRKGAAAARKAADKNIRAAESPEKTRLAANP